MSIHKCWDANLSAAVTRPKEFICILEYEEGFCGKWYYYHKEGFEAFRVLKKVILLVKRNAFRETKVIPQNISFWNEENEKTYQ